MSFLDALFQRVAASDFATVYHRASRGTHRNCLAEVLESRLLLSAAIPFNHVAQSAAAHPSVPAYSSRPGAPYTIFLDFGGFTFNGVWGTTIDTPGTTPAYDDNGDPTTFSAGELANIQAAWSRVAEAYAPFHINVTTVDPAVAAGKAGSDSQRQNYYDGHTQLMHTVIGGSGAWYGSAGGVSFQGVSIALANGGEHTDWIFSGVNNESSADNLQFIGDAAIHENGHGLGLTHQSDYNGNTLVNEYDVGNANFAPIMGVAYSAARALWASGNADNSSSNPNGPTSQNDVQIIVNDANMGGFVSDGIGHTTAAATALPLTGNTIISTSAAGLIVPKSSASPNPVGSSNYTTDLWSFTTLAGAVSFTVNSGRSSITPGTSDPGAMLNASLEILNASGTVVATAATPSLNETLNLALSAGHYFVEVLAAGDAADNTFTTRNFFDIGDYFLSGHIAAPNTIAGRYIFYKGSSAFDAASDSAAIALDKSALLPGQTAAFANYTSYNRGINGIMIDIAGVTGTFSTADFTFKIGNNNAPAQWPAASAPASILTLPGQGLNGATRVDITWTNNAIQNDWLQITIKGGTGSTSGLVADDVFYFGNAIGETGNAATDAKVTAVDEIGARVHAADLTTLQPSIAIANVYDFNRDGHVNATDEAIAGAHYTNFLNALRLISTPVAAPAASAIFTPVLNAPQVASPAPIDTISLAPPTLTAPALLLTPPRAPEEVLLPSRKKSLPTHSRSNTLKTLSIHWTTDLIPILTQPAAP